MRIEFQLYKLKKSYKDTSGEIIDILIDEIDQIPGLVVKEQKINPNYYNIATDNTIYAELKGEVNNLSFTLNLHKLSYGDNITINSAMNFEATANFENTYDIKLALKLIYKKHFKGLYIGIDDFNEDKCKELYSSIHNIENRFRYLINNLLIRKVGVEWFKDCVSEDTQYKVVGFSSWYRKNYKEFTDVQTDLFNLQTDDLVKLIENSNISGLPKDKQSDYVEIQKWLKKNLDFDTPELEVPDSFRSMYFDEILSNEFYEKWNEFNYVRNMIAHNKLICTDFIDDAQKLFTDLHNHLDIAEEQLDKFTTSDEKKVIERMYRDYADDFYFEEAGVVSTPSEKDVIYKINESNDGIDFAYVMLDRFDEIKNDSDELCDSLEWLYNEIDEQSNVEDIYYACKATANLIDQVEESSFVSLVEQLNESKEGLLFLYSSLRYSAESIIQNYRNQTVVNKEQIEEGIILNFKTLLSDELKIELVGSILPERASQDNLKLELSYIPKKGQQAMEHGSIEVNYADYELHEDGYSLPTYSDEMYVDISNVTDQILAYYSELEEVINDIQSCAQEAQI